MLDLILTLHHEGDQAAFGEGSNSMLEWMALLVLDHY